MASATHVTTSGSPSHVGQPVTITTAVKSAFGSIPDGELVTFSDGNTVLGTAPVAGGSAAFTTSALTAKKHTINANYGGDAAFKPSHGHVIQVVQPYDCLYAFESLRTLRARMLRLSLGVCSCNGLGGNLRGLNDTFVRDPRWCRVAVHQLAFDDVGHSF